MAICVCKSPRYATKAQWESDASQIAACYNACAGINPEAVPKMLEALVLVERFIKGECIDHAVISEPGKPMESLGERLRSVIALAGKESE